MKNTLKLIGIITLVAVIGFSMAACGNDEEESGLLTITGLGAYNGKFAIAVGEGSDDESLIAATNININNETVTCGEISGGSATLKVWKVEGEEGDQISIYEGNDTFDFYVVILNEATINGATFADIEDGSENIPYELLGKIAGIGMVEVTFKNGVASGKFTDLSMLLRP
jgi:hypothetical protein